MLVVIASRMNRLSASSLTCWFHVRIAVTRSAS
jgi:hypothetical protein